MTAGTASGLRKDILHLKNDQDMMDNLTDRNIQVPYFN